MSVRSVLNIGGIVKQDDRKKNVANKFKTKSAKKKLPPYPRKSETEKKDLEVMKRSSPPVHNDRPDFMKEYYDRHMKFYTDWEPLSSGSDSDESETEYCDDRYLAAYARYYHLINSKTISRPVARMYHEQLRKLVEICGMDALQLVGVFYDEFRFLRSDLGSLVLWLTRVGTEGANEVLETIRSSAREGDEIYFSPRTVGELDSVVGVVNGPRFDKALEVCKKLRGIVSIYDVHSVLKNYVPTEETIQDLFRILSVLSVRIELDELLDWTRANSSDDGKIDMVTELLHIRNMNCLLGGKSVYRYTSTIELDELYDYFKANVSTVYAEARETETDDENIKVLRIMRQLKYIQLTVGVRVSRGRHIVDVPGYGSDSLLLKELMDEHWVYTEGKNLYEVGDSDELIMTLCYLKTSARFPSVFVDSSSYEYMCPVASCTPTCCHMDDEVPGCASPTSTQGRYLFQIENICFSRIIGYVPTSLSLDTIVLGTIYKSVTDSIVNNTHTDRDCDIKATYVDAEKLFDKGILTSETSLLSVYNRITGMPKPSNGCVRCSEFKRCDAQGCEHTLLRRVNFLVKDDEYTVGDLLIPGRTQDTSFRCYSDMSLHLCNKHNIEFLQRSKTLRLRDLRSVSAYTLYKEGQSGIDIEYELRGIGRVRISVLHNGNFNLFATGTKLERLTYDRVTGSLSEYKRLEAKIIQIDYPLFNQSVKYIRLGRARGSVVAEIIKEV